MTERNTKAIVLTVIFVLLAVVSIVLAAPVLSDPDTYRSTFAAIDDKFGNVLSLTGVTVTASSAITLLPDDIGTPIANQLAEYTDYFLVIVSVLLAEKYLVTILAAIAFYFCMPAAFLASIPFFAWKLPSVRTILWRIALMFLALYLVIPASMKISAVIEETYQVSIESAITSISELGGAAAEQEEEEASGIGALWGKVTDTVASVTSDLTDIPQKASRAMNEMIQALAVMIVTSCIIPLLVLLVAFGIIKIITGVPMQPRFPHRRALPPHTQEPKKELPME